MKPDTSIREGYPPRGLCLVTGEDSPGAGQSTTARFLAVEVPKGAVSLDLLTECQNSAGKLSAAMRGYIEWLAPSLDDLPDQLLNKFRELRVKATSQNQHGRLPEAAAWLYIGLVYALGYAQYVEAISQEDRAELMKAAWQVLLKLADRQARRIADERPAEKFTNILRELIASGAAYLRDVVRDDAAIHDPGFLGWFDNEWAYLLPEVTYKVVCQFCAAQGGVFPVSARTLWKNLDTEGLIFTEKTGGEVRRLVKVSLPHGGRPRVLKLRLDVVREE